MTPEQHQTAANTDREIWRETPGDFYSPSIHVTEDGAIGINVGGTVIVRRLDEWHRQVGRIFVEKIPSSDRNQDGQDQPTIESPLTKEELAERLWKLCGRVYEQLRFSKRRDAIEFMESVVDAELEEAVKHINDPPPE